MWVYKILPYYKSKSLGIFHGEKTPSIRSLNVISPISAAEGCDQARKTGAATTSGFCVAKYQPYPI